MRIRNTAEFLQHLEVGDPFFHMTSHCHRPQGVIGPCYITKLYLHSMSPNKVGLWLVDYLYTVEEVVTARTSCIEDLTNEYHGVFTSEPEALIHFASRKYAYEHDPAIAAHLAARSQTIREFIELSKNHKVHRTHPEEKERSSGVNKRVKIRRSDT